MKWITKVTPQIWALLALAVCLAYGAFTGNLLACGLALILVGGLCQKGWQAWRANRISKAAATPPMPAIVAPRPTKKRARKFKPAATPSDYIQNMIDQGRYALLLREEVVSSIGEANAKVALEELEAMMSPVVGGGVHQRIPVLPNNSPASEASVPQTNVEPFYIDRFAVSNEDFKRFVDDQGYTNDEYWSEDIRSARSEFTDKTGQPGPRFWSNGTFPPGEAGHPVVGVSWYEAQAFARWQGKRLPSDAEWTKAASSPKTTSNLPSHQRKYPWGPSLEDGRANLWSTGIGATVAVDEFEDGDSPCQVRQLVGNVWEWSSDSFPGSHADASWQTPDTPFKSLRGGAFDTYFEHHVTCNSKSADDPAARKHNVGFRCVLSTDEITTPS